GAFLAVVLIYPHDLADSIHELAPPHDKAQRWRGMTTCSLPHRRRSAPLPERVAGLFCVSKQL
ncbi:MAG: hypothetical protein ACRYGP_29195, partial [Janthinobacterium lividum]